MPSPDVDIGSGTTLTFAGFTYQLTSLSISGLAREAIETTHLDTTANGVGSKTFIPTDFSDAGELSVEGHFNPDDSPPIESASATATITFPSTATWACSAFLTSIDVEVPLEDKMTFSATFKLTGAITITAVI